MSDHHLDLPVHLCYGDRVVRMTCRQTFSTGLPSTFVSQFTKAKVDAILRLLDPENAI